MYSELNLEVLCYLRVCEMMMGELPIQGLTWRKQAFVKSPRRANELCLTSGIVSWDEEKRQCQMLIQT